MTTPACHRRGPKSRPHPAVHKIFSARGICLSVCLLSAGLSASAEAKPVSKQVFPVESSKSAESLAVVEPVAGVEPVSEAKPTAKPTAKRRSLGLEAYEHGRFSTAVALLEATPLADRSASEQLHLARARARMGLWLQALDDYETLLAPQSPKRALPGWQEWRTFAEAEGATLGKRLPWAQLDFGESAPEGSSVFVDGHWVSPGRFQAPYPVNPGWHTFLLEVDGQVQAARRMYFEEGQQRTIRLVSPVSGKLATPPSQITAHLAPARSPLPGGDAPLPISTNTWRTSSYVAAAMGAIGITTSIGFSIEMLMARRRLLDQCQFSGEAGPGCVVSRDEARNYDQYQRSSAVATGAMAVGVVGLVSGGVMWFLANREEKATSEATLSKIQPLVGLNFAGVSGQF